MNIVAYAVARSGSSESGNSFCPDSVLANRSGAGHLENLDRSGIPTGSSCRQGFAMVPSFLKGTKNYVEAVARPSVRS